MDENGELKGVVWLYAAVDASLNATKIADPRREVFYRWAEKEEVEAVGQRYPDGNEGYFKEYEAFNKLAA